MGGRTDPTSEEDPKSAGRTAAARSIATRGAHEQRYGFVSVVVTLTIGYASTEVIGPEVELVN